MALLVDLLPPLSFFLLLPLLFLSILLTLLFFPLLPLLFPCVCAWVCEAL